MSAFNLRSALLLVFASYSAVAIAETAPRGPVGKRPFGQSAAAAGCLKATANPQAIGTSAPTAAPTDRIRNQLDLQAQERVVRLYAVHAGPKELRQNLAKPTAEPRHRTDAGLVAAVHTVPTAVRTAGSDQRATQIQQQPQAAPQIQNPDSASPPARRVHRVQLVSHTVQGWSAADHSRARRSETPASAAVIRPPVYNPLPVSVAFRVSQPFLHSGDLHPSGFRTSTESAVEEQKPAGQSEEVAGRVTTAAVQQADLTNSTELPERLTGPTRILTLDDSRVVVRLTSSSAGDSASRQVGPAAPARAIVFSQAGQADDDTEARLIPIPPVTPPAGIIDLGQDQSSGLEADIFRPIGSVTLGQANIEERIPANGRPVNQARQLTGASDPEYQGSLAHFSCYRPVRDAFPICYQPLYFEDPNLERCGQSHGCLTELKSIACFAGRVPLLPYLMTVQPPCSCVRAKPDCPTCSRFGHDAYIPNPDEIDLAGVAVQTAATVGLFLLLP